MQKIKEFLSTIWLEILCCLTASFLFWNRLFINPFRHLYGDFDFTITYLFANKISFLYFHEFPFFSSYIGGGFPLWANPQNMFFSVPQFFSIIIKNQWLAIRITILVLTTISMLGMFNLLKQLEIQNFGLKLFGAIIYTFSGFFVARMIIGHIIFHNIIYIPWLVSSFIWSYKNNKFSFAIPIWLAIMIYAGLHITSVFVIIILISLLFFCKFKRWLIYILLGFILAAPKIIPSYQLLSWFPKKCNMGYVANSVVKTYTVLLSALVWPVQNPNSWPFKCLTDKWLSSNMHEINGYIGILPVLLAGFCIYIFFKYKNYFYRRVVVSMLMITGIALFLYLGELNPVWQILSKNLVFGSLHIPTRFIGLVVLPIAVFSTLGLWIFVKNIKKKVNIILFGICIAVFLDYYRANLYNIKTATQTCALASRYYFNQDNTFEYNEGPDWVFIEPQSFEIDSMSGYLQKNQGILHFYDTLLGYGPYVFKKHSLVKEGRIDMFNSEPNIKIEWLSPSKIFVKVLKTKPEHITIPININYFPGWQIIPNLHGLTLNSNWTPDKWGLLLLDLSDKFPIMKTEMFSLRYSPSWKVKLTFVIAGLTLCIICYIRCFYS
ncbi:MAG: hypothetical protein AB1349_03600 [Elusimicrobiota bacterium]